MTENEALKRMREEELSGWHPGLERMYGLLDGLGHPERNVKFVHIAGTNGKGSTAAMTERILREAGFRTGLYTSPHLWTIRERFQINGEMIPPQALADVLEKVLDVNRTLPQPGTEFELLTAAAFLYFAESRCDIVVLEVGMGGLLDATNVISAPEIAVITNIGLEHTQYLGDTVGKIAAHKAGIIKRGCDAVLYNQSEEAERVVREKCDAENVRLTVTAPETLRLLSGGFDGQEFSYRGAGPFRLALPGAFQLRNAMTALDTIRVLMQRGWKIPEDAVRAGLSKTVWPGRMEVMHRRPYVIVDGAHNPQCMEALCEALSGLLPGGRYDFVIGVLGDKDYPAMMRCLIPLAKRFFVVPVDSPRALPVSDFVRYLRSRGACADACGTVEEGVARAMREAGGDDESVPAGAAAGGTAAENDAAGHAGAVCICGSLYMIGRARRFLLQMRAG